MWTKRSAANERADSFPRTVCLSDLAQTEVVESYTITRPDLAARAAQECAAVSIGPIV